MGSVYMYGLHLRVKDGLEGGEWGGGGRIAGAGGGGEGDGCVKCIHSIEYRPRGTRIRNIPAQVTFKEKCVNTRFVRGNSKTSEQLYYSELLPGWDTGPVGRSLFGPTVSEIKVLFGAPTGWPSPKTVRPGIFPRTLLICSYITGSKNVCTPGAHLRK